MTGTTSSTRGISRRTLAKGAAWAAPAVMVAASAPAFAASGPGPVIEQTGAACKNPGYSCDVHPKGCTAPIQVCNNSPLGMYIYSVTYTNVSNGQNYTYAPPPDLPIYIPPNTCQDVKLNAQRDSSANQSFTFDANVTWGHTASAADEDHVHPPVVTHMTVESTPPKCPCP